MNGRKNQFFTERETERVKNLDYFIGIPQIMGRKMSSICEERSTEDLCLIFDKIKRKRKTESEACFRFNSQNLFFTKLDGISDRYVEIDRKT